MQVKRGCYFKVACFTLAVWMQSLAWLWPAQGTGTLTETSRLLYRGDFGEAGARARLYLQAHPNDSAARILLARALLAQGNDLGAYSELSRVVRSDPKNIDGLYFLGRTSTILSQLEYQELCRMAPDSFRVHQLLAESYEAQQNKAKAEEEYLAALKANPQSSQILDGLGNLKRGTFQFDEAAKYYQRAVAISRHDYEGIYGLGACALFNHDLAKAIEYFREATNVDPQSSAARLALGDALLRDNQAAAAIDELKAAVHMRPEMRQAYSLLARAYARLGHSQLAQEALKKEQELAQADEERLERNLDSTKGLIPVAPEVGEKPPRNPQPEIYP
ncbi:MAG: tetratricopeptide repeat protein [Terriglobia bacterium]